MVKDLTRDPEIAIPFALIWGWLHLANHRYGTMPSGQMQVALTLVLFNALGYHPTITELAEITGLAKSNVSRYVGRQMESGFLEEYIDQADRRRRKLRPTAKAGPELEWQQQRLIKIYNLVREQHKAAAGPGTLDFKAMIKNLEEITHAAEGPAKQHDTD